MQTYRLEWNLCEINGVLNFTYIYFIWSSYTIVNFHLKMVFSDFTKKYAQLMEKWNSIKLTVSVVAIQTYFQER